MRIAWTQGTAIVASSKGFHLSHHALQTWPGSSIIKMLRLGPAAQEGTQQIPSHLTDKISIAWAIIGREQAQESKATPNMA